MPETHPIRIVDQNPIPAIFATRVPHWCYIKSDRHSPPPATARAALGKVLIVDDDRAFVHATAVTLRDAGYTVYSAFDIDAAMRCVQDHDPELLLLDVRMRDGGGFKLLEDLCTAEPLRERPAIFITGDTSTWISHLSIAMGIRRIIRKPFRPTELLAAIRSILN